MTNTIENKARLTENDLFIYTGHVATIMREPVGVEHTIDNPKVLRFSVGTGERQLHVEVKMWRRGESFTDPVWDSTSINGEHTGNRCGCTQRLSQLLFAAFEFRP